MEQHIKNVKIRRSVAWLSPKRCIKSLGLLVVLAAFVFLGHAFLKLDLGQVQFKSAYISAPGITVCVVAYAFMFLLVAGFSWKMTMECVSGKSVPTREIVALCGKANIARYLPGNVMHFVGRNLLGKRLGLDHVEMAFSTLLEAGIMVACAMVVLGVLLLTGQWRMPESIAALIDPKKMGRLGLAVALAGVVLTWLVVKKREAMKPFWMFLQRTGPVQWLALFVRMLALYLLWFFFNTLLFLVCLFMIKGATLPASSLALVFAASVMGWLFGFIVPGAPGGLGIRESCMIMMLTGVLDREYIFFGVMLSRVIAILGDGLVFLLAVRLQTRPGTQPGS